MSNELNIVPEPTLIQVALPVFRGVSAATVMGFYDVLTCAGRAWQAMTEDRAPARLFQPVLIGEQKGDVTCANGAVLRVERDYEDTPRFDLVVVSSILLPASELCEDLDPSFLRWLKSMHERGCAVASVCSGSLVLAAAGLLDGLEATTHWAYVGYFQENYPEVRLRAKEYLLDCGVSPAIITAGGGSSWHDLALHLVGQFIDTDTAAQTARVFLMHWHEDQQTVFACLTPALASADAAVARAQQVMRERCVESDVIDRAAESSGLTKRTYQRRFRQATGMTPTQQLQLLRCERAKQILQVTSKSVEEIAWEVGYEDTASFRRIFKKHNGIGPGEFRRRFLPRCESRPE